MQAKIRPSSPSPLLSHAEIRYKTRTQSQSQSPSLIRTQVHAQPQSPAHSPALVKMVNQNDYVNNSSKIEKSTRNSSTSNEIPEAIMVT